MSARNVVLGLATVLLAAGMPVATSYAEESAAPAAPTLEVPPATAAVQAIIDATVPDAQQYPGVTITVAGDSIQTLAPFLWFAPAIEKKFGIKVEGIALPFDTYYQSLQNDIVSGTGAFDILSYPPRFNGDFAAEGSIIGLDAFAKQWDPNSEDTFPVFRDLYQRSNGQLVALMMDGDHLELYFRKDLFENPEEQAAFQAKYGRALAPPATWDEYVEVASFFTRQAGDTLAGETLSEPFYGMSEITRLPDNFDWFLNRFASYGGIPFDADMQPQLDSPAGVAALENFIESIKYGPPGILNFEFTESFGSYLQGQTAMAINWTSLAKRAEDPNQGVVVGKTGYAQVPGVKQSDGSIVSRSTLAYSRVNAISKLSKNPEAAYRVLQFMTQPDVALAYTTETQSGMDPFLKSTYADPSKWVVQWPTIGDYVANNVKSLENAYPELTIPGAYRYSQALGQHVANALAGQETVEQALQAATDEWNAITDDLGRDTQQQFWRTELQNWQALGLAPTP